MRPTGRLVVVALACALAAVTAGCGHDEPTRTAARPLTTAGPSTGHLFAYGVVRRADEPEPGASVHVELWPEDGSDEEVGSVVHPWRSQQVTTDSRGRWSLRIDPDVLPSKYFPADHDFLNYDLDVTTRDHRQLATWSTTSWLLARPRVWRTDESRPGDSVPRIVVDLGRAGQDTGRIAITDSQGNTVRSPLQVD